MGYSSDMPTGARAPARERLLLHLKRRGPQTAADVAGHLAITEVAARQHLARLLDEGLVRYQERAGSVGRPARVYSITPAAANRFPDTHSELTVDLLDAARRVFGPSGVARLVADRTKRQLGSYRAHMPPDGESLAVRVAALARLRSAEGYMAEVEPLPGGGFLLVENHCPIAAAAHTCPRFCHDELSVFRRLLGRAVRVERTDHQLAGARRCAYRITPRGSPVAPRAQ